MGRLKRWWYLSTLLTITITSFNFFNCPDSTNHGYLYSAVSKALYNFKITRAQGARHNHFFFQNIQNNEIFEIFKMFKDNG